MRRYNEVLASLGMFKAISRTTTTDISQFQNHGSLIMARPSLIGKALRKSYRGIRFVHQNVRHRASIVKQRSHQFLNVRREISNMHFLSPSRPEVTIIILAYNKFRMTLDCLKSIEKNVSRDISYEVILVDNASTDTMHLLKGIDGLRYLYSETNRGFVGGCNYAAAFAKGKYIVFLNNDTFVCPNWLEGLYNTLDGDEGIGLVGSKLLYPDGTLQESGGIILNDGSGYNFGKHDNADDYKYNYVRDVDYCSGASIILRRSLFEELGGFDELYAPAYYEDTDLCFKIRQRGLRVVYQPTSAAYHIEGATAGISVSGGFKKYQAINHAKFLKRWKTILQVDHQAPNSDGVYIGRNRKGRNRVLIIDEYIPKPDRDSGSVRMTHLIECLQEMDYQVTFMPDSLAWEDGYTASLQQKGVEVIYAPFDFPCFAEDYGRFFDIVILSRPRVASYYINHVEAYFVNAVIVYDTVDLHYLRTKRQAEYSDERDSLILESSRLQIVESHLISRCDATFLVSDKEIPILYGDGLCTDEHLTVVSNIHLIDEGAYKSSFKDREDITFVGSFVHPPNCDAIRWFVNDIFPKIKKELPKLRLNIVGPSMPEALESDIKNVRGVVIRGYITDEELHNLLKRSRLFVAPLRYGAGVKGKIGQAIEYGVPVISTNVGAEGMHLENGESVVIADNAEDFFKAVVDLYNDRRTWDIMQKNARQTLEEYFSKDSVITTLTKLFKSN